MKRLLLIFMLLFLLTACAEDDPAPAADAPIASIPWQRPAAPLSASNAARAALTGMLTSHTGTVFATHFSADSQRYLTLGGDHRLFIWDMQTGETIFSLDDIQMAKLFNNGTSLAAINAQDQISVWSITDKAETFNVQHGALITVLAISQDETQLAIGAKNGSLTFYNLQTGNVEQQISAYGGGFAVTDLIYGDQALYAMGEDGTLLQFDRAALDTPQILESSYPPPLAIVSSLDHTSLAVIRPEQVNIYGARESSFVIEALASVPSAAFSPDGVWLAIGSNLDTVNIYAVATGERLVALPGHGNKFADLAFSADGALLATGQTSSSAFLWNLSQLHQTGINAAEIQVPRAPLQPVRSLRLYGLDWSLDGRFLALLDERGAVYMMGIRE